MDVNDHRRAGGRFDTLDSEPYESPTGGNGQQLAPGPFPVRFLTEPPTKTRWLIGGLLPAGGCAIIGAEPKAGKTWITFDMALALATGRKVLGRWQVEGVGKTLFYSPESGWNARTLRLWGLCWGRGLDPHNIAPMLPFIDARLDLAREAHIAQLTATVAEHEPRLLVIDPLVSAHLGLDENVSGDVMKVLNPLRDLTTAHPDTAILVVHHHGKGARDRTRNAGLRGSSAIGGWWDTLITLRRADDDSAAPRRLDIEHRDAPAPAPGGFQLATGPADEDPDLSWFRLESCDPPEMGKKGRPGGRKLDPDMMLEVYDLVRKTSGTLTRNAGATRLGWKDHKKFTRYFEALEERGLVQLGANDVMEVVP